MSDATLRSSSAAISSSAVFTSAFSRIEIGINFFLRSIACHFLNIDAVTANAMR
jgi:hypothetical protein